MRLERVTFPEGAAHRLAGLFDRSPGLIRIALSGGRTPAPVLEFLAPLVDWSRVELYQCDERCVPPEHPDSNYGMIARSLLSQARPRTIHRMRGEANPAAAAAEYAGLLPAALDIVVLGLGDDGHTASLFPGTAALSSKAPAAANLTPAGMRLTLTLPALNAAAERVFLVRGRKDVLRRIESEKDLPAARIRDPLWLVD